MLKYEVCFKLDSSIIDENRKEDEIAYLVGDDLLFKKKRRRRKNPIGESQLLSGTREEIKNKFLRNLDDLFDQLEKLYYGD